jgi:hypothetical protein
MLALWMHDTPLPEMLSSAGGRKLEDSPIFTGCAKFDGDSESLDQIKKEHG